MDSQPPYGPKPPPKGSNGGGRALSPTSESEQEVIGLSTTFIGLLNAREFNNPWFAEHMTDDVRSELQGYPPVFGKAAAVGMYALYAASCNGFQVGIENISAVVEPHHGLATVLVSQRLCSWQTQERRMGGTLLTRWLLSGDRWRCQGAIMMLGTPEFFL